MRNADDVRASSSREGGSRTVAIRTLECGCMMRTKRRKAGPVDLRSMDCGLWREGREKLCRGGGGSTVRAVVGTYKHLVAAGDSRHLWRDTQQ